MRQSTTGHSQPAQPTSDQETCSNRLSRDGHRDPRPLPHQRLQKAERRTSSRSTTRAKISHQGGGRVCLRPQSVPGWQRRRHMPTARGSLRAPSCMRHARRTSRSMKILEGMGTIQVRACAQAALSEPSSRLSAPKSGAAHRAWLHTRPINLHICLHNEQHIGRKRRPTSMALTWKLTRRTACPPARAGVYAPTTQVWPPWPRSSGQGQGAQGTPC